jgi:ADP-heptose:LPS heptosyltransferase
LNPGNILAVRFMRLGDVTLLLPALTHLKKYYPQSRLTLLTDQRCVPLAEMCPSIDDVMSVDRLGMRDGPLFPALKNMTKLIAEVRRRRFDLVIDFLSFRETNLLAWLSGAPKRLGMKRYDRSYLGFCFNMPPVKEDKSIHVAEMFQRIVDSVAPGYMPCMDISPVLVVPDHARDWAANTLPNGPVLSLYVDAPVPERQWPEEDFAEVARFAAGKLGATVAVLAGGGGNLRPFSEIHDRVIALSNVSIPQLAAVIARSKLLISNDTGPMHLGPALGIPTLGLFSVGYPEHYRPLGERSRFLRAENIDDIGVGDVIEQIGHTWNAG